MKFCKAAFLKRDTSRKYDVEGTRPELPDTLTDYLTGAEIPFSNRDNIRQKIVRFLVEEKGFLKEDIAVDREIVFELDGAQVSSLVDISVRLNGLTLIVWKCSSGSLVSRERQIVASSRLLESYVVPFAAVTNGKDIELLDSSAEEVIGSGFESIPTRQELLKRVAHISLKMPNNKKIIYEQRILYTYDAISCPVKSGQGPSP